MHLIILETPPLKPGTLLICRKNHKVIDFVAYSMEMNLYLIQASTGGYDKHDSKYEDLFTKCINQVPVVDYYASYCKKADGTDRFPGLKGIDKKNFHLPEGIHYMYITPNSHENERVHRNVLLIDKELLGWLGPDSNLFTNGV